MSNWHEVNVLKPNRTRIIIIYPTVDPEVVIVPIVSSIFVFPLVVLLVICCLRKRAARARQKARLAHREDLYSERSCASIVQRSPPLSISGGNQRFSTIDCELTTTVEIVTPDS